jgi:gamma-glutamyltranspeptidase
MLNIYDLYPASNNASDPLATHRMIEAMKFAFADRGQLGDPGFADLKGVYPEMIEGRARVCVPLAHQRLAHLRTVVLQRAGGDARRLWH